MSLGVKNRHSIRADGSGCAMFQWSVALVMDCFHYGFTLACAREERESLLVVNSVHKMKEKPTCRLSLLSHCVKCYKQPIEFVIENLNLDIFLMYIFEDLVLFIFE